MKRLRTLHVAGARPNFMKVGPLFAELARRQNVDQALVHTGQHYDAAMSDVFFRDLGIPAPDFNLEVGSGSHAVQTAQIMARFEPVLQQFQPDWVVVPGDVNSTLACALVAAKQGVKVAHVEAGLRSYDRTMPEEINRVLTDQISDLLFTPSPEAEGNLLKEGIAPERIRFVGNIMIDSLIRLLPHAEAQWPLAAEALGIAERYVLATLHRPANVDDRSTLDQLVAALNLLAEEIKVVFPVHPRTRTRLLDSGSLTLNPNLILCEPMGYIEFLGWQKHAALVITDSGGVQEETTFLGVPCLTARPNTERPVTLTSGTNELVSCRTGAILEAARRRLRTPAGPGRPPELWDGSTAARIADVLQEAYR